MFKKICLVAAVFILAAVSGFAELRQNPDTNTLWSIETGNITGWYDNSLSRGIKANPNGGFFIGDDNPINRGHVIRHKVPVSADKPWLVFDVTSVETFNKQKYQRWGLCLQKMNPGIGSITNVEPGYYAVNCFENAPALPAKDATGILRAYFFDMELCFNFIRMVKTPDYYVEACSPAFETKKSFSPGDEVTFRVHLKEPAEEVTLKVIDFNYLYNISVNGKPILELTPEDEAGKVWSTKVKIQSLTCGNRGLGSMLLLRATVLGGKIQKPIWGVINYPYKKEAGK